MSVQGKLGKAMFAMPKKRRTYLSPMGAVCAFMLMACGTQLAHAERKTTYYHTDGLGSVVAASDENGALLWRKEYAPYGEQLDSIAENEKLAYTGKEHDGSTGLTYFGARYYDPQLGRFVSVDPVGFVESNPMSFNRYSYANSNPYRYVDPDGAYICEGTSANCGAVNNGLDRARQVLRSMQKGPANSRLAEILAFYGKQGEDNGVSVVFSRNVGMGQHFLRADGSSKITFHDTFSEFGTGWKGAVNLDVQAAVLIHEGSHGIDARSMGRNPGNKLEALQTERTAYGLQSTMHEMMRSRSLPEVWNPAWPASEATTRRKAAVEAAAQRSASGWVDK